MPRNYSDNVTKSGSLIVTSWTKDTILKRFIDLIREDLHANSVIPIRSWNNEIIGGTYRQEMAQQFNDIIYPRRQLVENKFSVLKRKFSGDLKARRFLIQMKEIANKMIVCNIHRFLQFLIVKVFGKKKSAVIYAVFLRHNFYESYFVIKGDFTASRRFFVLLTTVADSSSMRFTFSYLPDLGNLFVMQLPFSRVRMHTPSPTKFLNLHLHHR